MLAFDTPIDIWRSSSTPDDEPLDDQRAVPESMPLVPFPLEYALYQIPVSPARRSRASWNPQLEVTFQYRQDYLEPVLVFHRRGVMSILKLFQETGPVAAMCLSRWSSDGSRDRL